MKTEATSSESLELAERRIEWVLSHPHMSDWLKHALRAAQSRAPVDVLNDLQLLETLLQGRAHALIERTMTAAAHDHAAGDASDKASTEG